MTLTSCGMWCVWQIVFDDGRHFESNILGLFSMGLLLRIIAYLGLKYYNRDKQV
jgi:hypothetical protein